MGNHRGLPLRPSHERRGLRRDAKCCVSTPPFPRQENSLLRLFSRCRVGANLCVHPSHKSLTVVLGRHAGLPLHVGVDRHSGPVSEYGVNLRPESRKGAACVAERGWPVRGASVGAVREPPLRPPPAAERRFPRSKIPLCERGTKGDSGQGEFAHITFDSDVYATYNTGIRRTNLKIRWCI